jgi:hypothetical protein
MSEVERPIRDGKVVISRLDLVADQGQMGGDGCLTMVVASEPADVLAHRVFGRITGPAGSECAYLDETSKRDTPCKDPFDVPTYLWPDLALPPLPGSLRHDFEFSSK